MHDTDKNPLNRLILPVTRMAALASGYLLLFLAIILSFEIILRKLFAFSLQGVDDLGGYVLAISTSIGAGYALSTRLHTRVDMVITRLPGRARGFLNTAAMVTMGCLAIFATWRCSVVLRESIEFGSLATNPLQTPMWLPQSVWLAGMVFFAVVAGTYAVHALVLFVTRPEKVNAFYGVVGDPDAADPAGKETDAPTVSTNNGQTEGVSHE